MVGKLPRVRETPKAAHSPEATPIVPKGLAKKGAVGLQPIHWIQCQILQVKQKASGPPSTKQDLQSQDFNNLGTLTLLNPTQ